MFHYLIIIVVPYRWLFVTFRCISLKNLWSVDKQSRDTMKKKQNHLISEHSSHSYLRIIEETLQLLAIISFVNFRKKNNWHDLLYNLSNPPNVCTSFHEKMPLILKKMCSNMCVLFTAVLTQLIFFMSFSPCLIFPFLFQGKHFEDG